MLSNRLQTALGLILFTVTTFSAPVTAQDNDYRQIEWIELMPEDDLVALLNPPETIELIVDGSDEDSVASLEDVDDEATQRYLAALESTTVVTDFDNSKIRLPGFIVPLELKEDFLAVEFLMVPFFGACLHMPPPPPNQIIYVVYPEGVELNSYQDPFWFEGTLKIETTASDMGTAAYTLVVDSVTPYTE